MMFDIPDFRRKQQVPNWLQLQFHPAPSGQVFKVRDAEGHEFDAIQTHSREWFKCSPTGRIAGSPIPKPIFWLNGFVIA